MTDEVQEKESASPTLITEEDRLRGLAHVDVLRGMIDAARRERLRRSTVSRPRSARERHLHETGHELEHGCCRELEVSAA